MSDLISRQAALEKLESLMKDMENEIEDAKKHPENYTKNFIRGVEEQVVGLAYAAHEIIDMPSATGWIPVSERLPEKRRNVLITDRKITAEGEYVGNGLWCQYRWSAWRNSVVAWMPMPEPYREDGEE